MPQRCHEPCCFLSSPFTQQLNCWEKLLSLNMLSCLLIVHCLVLSVFLFIVLKWLCWLVTPLKLSTILLIKWEEYFITLPWIENKDCLYQLKCITFQFLPSCSDECPHHVRVQHVNLDVLVPIPSLIPRSYTWSKANNLTSTCIFILVCASCSRALKGVVGRTPLIHYSWGELPIDSAAV